MKKIIFTLTLLLMSVHGAQAKTLMSLEKALIKLFPKAEAVFDAIDLSENDLLNTDINPDTLPLMTRYRMEANGQTVGFTYEFTVRGKWGPIQFVLAVNEEGQIIDSIILEYKEIRGKGIAKNRYLRQYNGKSLSDPLTVGDDISGISGATISSRSFTEGVQTILQVHELIQSRF